MLIRYSAASCSGINECLMIGCRGRKSPVLTWSGFPSGAGERATAWNVGRPTYMVSEGLPAFRRARRDLVQRFSWPHRQTQRFCPKSITGIPGTGQWSARAVTFDHKINTRTRSSAWGLTDHGQR